MGLLADNGVFDFPTGLSGHRARDGGVVRLIRVTLREIEHESFSVRRRSAHRVRGRGLREKVASLLGGSSSNGRVVPVFSPVGDVGSDAAFADSEREHVGAAVVAGDVERHLLLIDGV